jgi:glycine hydroxymethyltransferase
MAETAGYTCSHHVAVDARPLGGGTSVSRHLEPANILATGIPLPLPALKGDYNGLRLGTQEVTRWGMGPVEMIRIAQFMARRALHGERPEPIGRDVAELREAFRTIGFCVEPGA